MDQREKRDSLLPEGWEEELLKGPLLIEEEEVPEEEEVDKLEEEEEIREEEWEEGPLFRKGGWRFQEWR